MFNTYPLPFGTSQLLAEVFSRVIVQRLRESDNITSHGPANHSRYSKLHALELRYEKPSYVTDLGGAMIDQDRRGPDSEPLLLQSWSAYWPSRAAAIGQDVRWKPLFLKRAIYLYLIKVVSWRLFIERPKAHDNLQGTKPCEGYLRQGSGRVLENFDTRENPNNSTWLPLGHHRNQTRLAAVEVAGSKCAT